MKNIVLASALILPLTAGFAMAAGGGSEVAPKKPKCKTGEIYDKKTKACVAAEESNLDLDSLYENLRELAYAGRYNDVFVVLAQMPEDDDRRLTYMGFTNRKMGNMDIAMAYYARALVVNPSNVLARSYMGQALVEQGKMTEAITQLREIRTYGGTGSWAEASLRTAIATGKTFNY